MSEREELARRVAERLGLIYIELDGDWYKDGIYIPTEVRDALLSAEQRVGELTAELAKCGRENCFGQEVEGCRRWVSEESLLKSKARVAALQEALPIVLTEWERAFRRIDWDADEAHEIRKRISGAEAALSLKAKETR